MAKFLNKKEQAIDFQLTPYGKYKLSVGGLEPAYYSFYDNGVLYDSQYAGFTENQNDIHGRIKRDTSYLEGITFFQEIDRSPLVSDLTRTAYGTTRSLWMWSASFETLSAYALTTFGKAPTLSMTAEEYDVFADDWSPWARDDHWQVVMGPGGTYEGGFFVNQIRYTSMFDFDINPTLNVPDPDIFSFDACIGDAYFEGETTQAAPAWKAVACQGEITYAGEKDRRSYYTGTGTSNTEKEYEIPQLDMEMYYRVVATTPESVLFAEEIPTVVASTPALIDGNVLRLERGDMVLYLDETNTELLTENFEIEVFEINEEYSDVSATAGTVCTTTADCAAGFKCRSSTAPGVKRCVQGPMWLTRKYFEKEIPQIVDGMMEYSNPVENISTDVTSNAVEYYFELLTDSAINQKIGCQCANIFNKSSYYIDIDFDCEEEKEKEEYYDIYGSVTVPEICAPDEEIYTEDLCEDLEEIE